MAGQEVTAIFLVETLVVLSLGLPPCGVEKEREKTPLEKKKGRGFHRF